MRHQSPGVGGLGRLCDLIEGNAMRTPHRFYVKLVLFGLLTSPGGPLTG